MKNVKKLTIILTIVLLCLVSFIGIYVKKPGTVKNIVKDYELGMNLGGYREVRLSVADDQEVTNDKVEQVKELLQKRLNQLGAKDYLLKTDYITGEIVIEIEETDNTDQIVADIYGAGNIKFVDSEDTSKIFMTNADIEEVSLKYSSSENGTGIYLDFDFTDEGAKMMEDLSSNAYKTVKTEEKTESTEGEETTEGTTETTTEGEEATEEEVKQPKLTLMIDDTQLLSSSFDNPVTGGRLQLSLNAETTNADKIQQAVNTGMAISTILNNGPLPIKYELNSNTYIYSDISEEIKLVFVTIIGILILIALTILIIKYKVSGLLSSISYIGFIAVYLLILRYANVVISLEGVAGILVILITNYLLTQKLLTKESTLEAFKEMGIQSIPVIAVIIAFSFINWTNIASFGMTMFWGIILITIYNFIVTKALLEK